VSSGSPEGISKHPSSSNWWSSSYQLCDRCSHTDSCNKCFQTVHHTISTTICNSGNIRSFRESSQPFPQYYPSVWGCKDESWTVTQYSLPKQTSFWDISFKLNWRRHRHVHSSSKNQKRREWNRVERIMHQNWPTVIVISACTTLIA